VEDLKVFKEQLRRNEVENMHVRNEQWLQNRENKIYNELKMKEEANETECTYKPKTNKPPRKIIGSFLDRCQFDMQKRKLNQRELFDRDQSECTFQPQIAPKSGKMAAKRHEMLQRLDYITSFNTEDLDTEYILQSGGRRAGFSNYDTEYQDGEAGVKKSFLKLKYDGADGGGGDDDSESRSVVDAGRIFFFCRLVISFLGMEKNYFSHTHASLSKSRAKHVNAPGSPGKKTVIQMHKDLLYVVKKPGTGAVAEDVKGSRLYKTQNEYETLDQSEELNEKMYHHLESLKKMQTDTSKLKLKYSDQMNKRITFDKSLKTKLQDGTQTDTKKESFTDIYYSPRANKNGTLIDLTPKLATATNGRKAKSFLAGQTVEDNPGIRITSPDRSSFPREEDILIGNRKKASRASGHHPGVQTMKKYYSSPAQDISKIQKKLTVPQNTQQHSEQASNHSTANPKQPKQPKKSPKHQRKNSYTQIAKSKNLIGETASLAKPPLSTNPRDTLDVDSYQIKSSRVNTSASMLEVGRSPSSRDYFGQNEEVDMIVAPKSGPMYFDQAANFVSLDIDYGKGASFGGNFVSDSIEFVRFSQNSEKSPEGAGGRGGSNESWKSQGFRVGGGKGVCDSQERNAADIIRLVEYDLRN
jgi:hypothetical protein